MGKLTQHIIIIDRDTSERHDVYTTPSMWAKADEWRDKLRMSSRHSEKWLTEKFIEAIWLQAARREGLMPAGDLTVDALAEMDDRLDFELPDQEQAAPSDDARPTEPAPGPSEATSS